MTTRTSLGASHSLKSSKPEFHSFETWASFGEINEMDMDQGASFDYYVKHYAFRSDQMKTAELWSGVFCSLSMVALTSIRVSKDTVHSWLVTNRLSFGNRENER